MSDEQRTPSGLVVPPGILPADLPTPDRLQVIGFRAQPWTAVARTPGEPDEVLPVMNLDFLALDGVTVAASLAWVAQPEQMRDARVLFGQTIDDALKMARRRRKVAR